MTKRRAVSNLLFGGRRFLRRGGVSNVVNAVSGTGTSTRGGILTLVAATNLTSVGVNTGGKVYVVGTAGQSVGVLIGTGLAIGTY